jgi:hypothetical protein
LHGLSSENEEVTNHHHEKFKRYWNHVELMVTINACKVDLEKGLICAGPMLVKVFLADAKCPTPGKLGLSRQDPGPAREPSLHPNYTYPYIIPGAKIAIYWIIGAAIVKLMNRIRSKEYDGGLPFHPENYGLRHNDFNDKMFCPLPITTYGNSAVDMKLALALRISALVDQFH